MRPQEIPLYFDARDESWSRVGSECLNGRYPIHFAISALGHSAEFDFNIRDALKSNSIISASPSASLSGYDEINIDGYCC